MGWQPFSLLTRHNRQADVQKVMQRVIEASSPSRNLVTQELRREARSGRTLPVLLFWQEAGEDQGPFFGLTRDLSSQGLSIVYPQPIAAETIVVGFAIEEELNLLTGSVRCRYSLGPFWVLGVQLEGVLPKGERAELESALSSFATL